jgi:uncharacterized protein (TIGR00297 family)
MIYPFMKLFRVRGLLKRMVNILFFSLLIGVTALAGFKVKSLTYSGVFGTIVVGFATALAFGFKGLLMLGLFFLTSSFWSHWKREQKQKAQDKSEKGERRDFIQVFANGGISAAAGSLYLLFQSPLWLVIFLCGIAAANADTWASEIGTVSKRNPFHVLKWKKVERGTSGAVSILGTSAALCGSMLIGLFSFVLWDIIDIKVALIIVIVGFLGNFLDTIIGGSIQVSYRCVKCGVETEKRIHCSLTTRRQYGVEFINNDVVNFISILGACIIGGVVYLWM